MAETLSDPPVRSSPVTGTVLPLGRPFWIVDGRAYDFTDWMRLHPGGATWLGPARGAISVPWSIPTTGNRLGCRDFLPNTRSKGVTEQDILPKLGVPPFLLEPEFDATTDLPRLDYRDEGSLLAEIRQRVNAKFSKRALKKYDRAFDAVTWAIGIAHVAALALLIANIIPGWAFIVIMVVTRTGLAGSGHYHLHRKWNSGGADTRCRSEKRFSTSTMSARA